MTPDEVLAALDPDQQEVARALGGPVAVLAGAGSGKTRAITHRIAYAVLSGRVREDRVLPLAFTVRAAAEMGGRLRALGVPGVRARTFHAAALAQVRYFWPAVAGGAVPRVLSAKHARIGDALREAALPSSDADVRAVAAAIERAKVTQVAVPDYLAYFTDPAHAADAPLIPGWSTADLAAAYAAYEHAKDARGEIDFEDCLLLAVALLEEDPRAADAVRAQYTAFVVDEYQDVNPLQQRLLEVWLGGRDDLCVVGDPAQSIYSFTGASPDYLLRFADRHPAATRITLDRDYRSTPQVVAAANRLLTTAPAGEQAFSLRLRAQRPDGPEPVLCGHDTEAAEAAWVAAETVALISDGVPPSEIAVLVRSNSQADGYAAALRAAGVPATIGTDRWFARPEVRRAIIRLRGLRAADESVPAVTAAAEALTAEGFEDARPGTGPAAARWDAQQALLRLAESLGPDATAGDLIEDLVERESAAAPPPLGTVVITTLHAAKGLEWEAVFLPGLVDGVLPTAQAVTGEAVAEERRLLYVGITRARRHLMLSWWGRRAGAGAEREPSRFLAAWR